MSRYAYRQLCEEQDARDYSDMQDQQEAPPPHTGETHMKNGKPDIRTSHDRPPIPRDGSHAWHAWEDDDAESGPYGYGPTEAAAIADLAERLEDARF